MCCLCRGRPPRRHSKSSSLPEDDEMSGYGTMKFSSTMQRGREASDAESVTSEVQNYLCSNYPTKINLYMHHTNVVQY